VPSIPEDVSGDEVIVRGVCSPYHVDKNGRLTKGLYNPEPDSDELSVMRHDHMGSDACKARAKELEDVAKKKIYTGLAVFSANHVRTVGWDVKDSRSVYMGHADIKVGVVRTRGEPLPADKLHVFHAQRKKLLNLTNYFPDPDPGVSDWTGAKVVFKD
jgi:hypothetical protein